MKINYEDIGPEDLEEGEIEVDIDKDAFKGPLVCAECNKKMQKTIINLNLPGKAITLHLEAYRCIKCNKEYLSGDQAEKFDSMLVLIDALKQQPKFKFERAANYDGKNWFIRFPSDLTKKWNKQMITDIIPITNRDFFIHIKDKVNPK